jgi:type II secretory pathway predicted ATPase ExeA
LFDASAIAQLHELTRGVPRTVNRLAKLALEYGWTKDAHQITGSHVNAVAQDIALHQAVPLAA